MVVPTRPEVEERLKEVLRTELNVSPEVLAATGPATPLLGRGLGLDSVESLALVSGLESAFDIYVEDGEFTESLFKDLGTLTEFVLRKTDARARNRADP